MYDSGEHTVEQIAKAFKTTRPTIYRATIGTKPANRAATTIRNKPTAR